MTDENRVVSRRGFLTAAGTAATIGGATGTVAAQEDGGPVEVTVGPGGDFVFEPDVVYVQPGQTVRWVWDSDFHNIVPGEIPGGASWEGTPGPASQTYDTGYTYEHSFQTLGTYNYWCEPHKPQGMIADVIVNESGQPPDTGGGSVLPESARTLGVAATGGLVSVLGLAYFFLKYGGDTT